mgnify:CR=1 FL=1
MKEKIKKILPISTIILIIIIILGGTFYWFQWRPSQIIQGCFRQKQETREAYSDLRSVSDEKVEEYAEMRYQDCLRRHGLEK